MTSCWGVTIAKCEEARAKWLGVAVAFHLWSRVTVRGFRCADEVPPGTLYQPPPSN